MQSSFTSVVLGVELRNPNSAKQVNVMVHLTGFLLFKIFRFAYTFSIEVQSTVFGSFNKYRHSISPPHYQLLIPYACLIHLSCSVECKCSQGAAMISQCIVKWDFNLNSH